MLAVSFNIHPASSHVNPLIFPLFSSSHISPSQAVGYFPSSEDPCHLANVYFLVGTLITHVRSLLPLADGVLFESKVRISSAFMCLTA